MKKMTPEAWDKARETIEKAIAANGTYSHNLCSVTLRGVANLYGIKIANHLVMEFKLTERFGIQSVKKRNGKAVGI